jgi:hypothetical protein
VKPAHAPDASLKPAAEPVILQAGNKTPFIALYFTGGASYVAAETGRAELAGRQADVATTNHGYYEGVTLTHFSSKVLC